MREIASSHAFFAVSNEYSNTRLAGGADTVR
jgi:hypothetical protein